eukprot:Rmarinus@m.9730
MVQRKVAFAVDCEDQTKAAFTFYLDNLKREGDEICLIHVRDPLESDNKLMEYYASQCQKENLKYVSVSEAPGDIRKVLENALKAHNPDFLVMGKRPMSTIGRWVYGSVSDFAAKHIPYPIVVAKSPAFDESLHDSTRGSGRILTVAVDPSDIAKRSFHWCVDNVARRGDTIQLLHVSDAASMGLPILGWKRENQMLAIENMMKYFTDYGERFMDKGITVSTKVAEVGIDEDARDVLIEAVIDANTDILVMGNRGMGVVKRLLLGSMSGYAVDHSPCPVAIYKIPSDPSS